MIKFIPQISILIYAILCSSWKYQTEDYIVFSMRALIVNVERDNIRLLCVPNPTFDDSVLEIYLELENELHILLHESGKNMENCREVKQGIEKFIYAYDELQFFATLGAQSTDEKYNHFSELSRDYGFNTPDANGRMVYYYRFEGVRSLIDDSCYADEEYGCETDFLEQALFIWDDPFLDEYELVTWR